MTVWLENQTVIFYFPAKACLCLLSLIQGILFEKSNKTFLFKVFIGG